MTQKDKHLQDSDSQTKNVSPSPREKQIEVLQQYAHAQCKSPASRTADEQEVIRQVSQAIEMGNII